MNFSPYVSQGQFYHVSPFSARGAAAFFRRAGVQGGAPAPEAPLEVKKIPRPLAGGILMGDSDQPK